MNQRAIVLDPEPVPHAARSWRGGGMAGTVLAPTNGMDAPTRNGINVPKWMR